MGLRGRREATMYAPRGIVRSSTSPAMSEKSQLVKVAGTWCRSANARASPAAIKATDATATLPAVQRAADLRIQPPSPRPRSRARVVRRASTIGCSVLAGGAGGNKGSHRGTARASTPAGTSEDRPGRWLAGLGDLRAALEGAGLGGEPVLLLLLGLGLLFKRRG